jgi:hypothetical protein
MVMSSKMAEMDGSELDQCVSELCEERHIDWSNIAQNGKSVNPPPCVSEIYPYAYMSS